MNRKELINDLIAHGVLFAGGYQSDIKGDCSFLRWKTNRKADRSSQVLARGKGRQSMANQNFAELLKSARSAAGISKSEFARQLGLDRKEIYRYENGEKVPYDDRLLAICEALAIDVNAATAARAVSIQHDADRGKSNATTRSIAAAYARSCRKQRETVPGKKHIGFCPCFGVKFSSVAALLRACLVRQKNGEKRCQSCEVLSSCGKDEEALRKCNITIMEMP